MWQSQLGPKAEQLSKCNFNVDFYLFWFCCRCPQGWACTMTGTLVVWGIYSLQELSQLAKKGLNSGQAVEIMASIDINSHGVHVQTVSPVQMSAPQLINFFLGEMIRYYMHLLYTPFNITIHRHSIKTLLNNLQYFFQISQTQVTGQ